MLDSSLAPVWFAPVPTNLVASNLEAQTYDGRPVLTWWQGDVSATGAINRGEDIVVNDHYRRWPRSGRRRLGPDAARDGDPGHDAWVTANKNVRADLSGDGGVSNGVLTDSAVQEYDLRTGRLLYSWSALAHIPRHDSYTQPPSNGFPWDAYHVNSVEPLRQRHVPGLDAQHLGGLPGQRAHRPDHLDPRRQGLELHHPEPGAFKWQHDAELHCRVDGDAVRRSLLRHHRRRHLSSGDRPVARAHAQARSGRPHRERRARSTPTARPSTPSTWATPRSCPTATSFVGWGEVPFVSEYTASGKLIFDAAFPSPDMSYRAYVQPWVGKPLSPPSGAARAQGAGTTVYASWNGATQVSSWRVLAVTAGGGDPAAGHPHAHRV